MKSKMGHLLPPNGVIILTGLVTYRGNVDYLRVSLRAVALLLIAICIGGALAFLYNDYKKRQLQTSKYDDFEYFRSKRHILISITVVISAVVWAADANIGSPRTVLLLGCFLALLGLIYIRA